MHDLLINSDGLSLSKNHSLREIISKHRTRLNAELTRVRLTQGYSTLGELRIALNYRNHNDQVASSTTRELIPENHGQKSRPRWVRINTIRTSLAAQLQTTFADFKRVKHLDDLLIEPKTLFIDNHVPNLIAVSPLWQANSHPEYQRGALILQDKASCIPAVLLEPRADTKCLDACAAPGNKTTHLASLISESTNVPQAVKIWACERDGGRAIVLDKMIRLAGAEILVNIQAGRDFLGIDPNENPWKEISHLLLDPSCSGSGIVGRNEELHIELASATAGEIGNRPVKRRKKNVPKLAPPSMSDKSTSIDEKTSSTSALKARLSALGRFQLRLLLHAFSFPSAERITYSTCSVYAEENEHVVLKALLASAAEQRGWKLLCRNDQPEGLKAWPVRGDKDACVSFLGDQSLLTAEDVAEACIRCMKDTKEYTQGFFVAGFIQQSPRNGASTKSQDITHDELEEEWTGFGED